MTFLSFAPPFVFTPVPVSFTYTIIIPCRLLFVNSQFHKNALKIVLRVFG